jgi:hypothetical protein
MAPSRSTLPTARGSEAFPSVRPCAWCGESFAPKRSEATCCELHRKKQWRRAQNCCANCGTGQREPDSDSCSACAEFAADRAKVAATGLDPFSPMFDLGPAERTPDDEQTLAAA